MAPTFIFFVISKLSAVGRSFALFSSPTCPASRPVCGSLSLSVWWTTRPYNVTPTTIARPAPGPSLTECDQTRGQTHHKSRMRERNQKKPKKIEREREREKNQKETQPHRGKGKEDYKNSSRGWNKKNQRSIRFLIYFEVIIVLDFPNDFDAVSLKLFLSEK